MAKGWIRAYGDEFSEFQGQNPTGKERSRMPSIIKNLALLNRKRAAGPGPIRIHTATSLSQERTGPLGIIRHSQQHIREMIPWP